MTGLCASAVIWLTPMTPSVPAGLLPKASWLGEHALPGAGVKPGGRAVAGVDHVPDQPAALSKSLLRAMYCWLPDQSSSPLIWLSATKLPLA